MIISRKGINKSQTKDSTPGAGRKPAGLDATPSVRFYDSLKGGGGPESTKPC
jgi:hypothetical protein